MLAITFVLFSVVLLSVWFLSTPKRKLPTGPKGKPFIGVLTELDTKKMHQQLVDWTHKYGGFLSFKVFGTVSVVISDEKLLREAYSSSAYASLFNDRPDTFVGKYVLFNYSDVGFAMYDDATTKLRKAMHKGLHFYGDGIKQFEDLMTKELKRLVKEISDNQGKEVDPRPIIENSIGLLMSALLLGREMQDGDKMTTKAIWEFLEVLNEVMAPAVDTMLRIVPALSCKKDVEFNGYLIPAGAQIFANIWYIHHNPALFSDPWTFKPDRFLDESGQVLDAKHPTRMNVLTFGVGPRNCVGESLAKSRVILYLSTLLKTFDVVVTSDISAHPNLYRHGLVLGPTSYKCKFIPRNPLS